MPQPSAAEGLGPCTTADVTDQADAAPLSAPPRARSNTFSAAASNLVSGTGHLVSGTGHLMSGAFNTFNGTVKGLELPRAAVC